MLRIVLLVLALAWAAGCSKSPAPVPAASSDAATGQLLSDMEGVWRSSEPEQLLYLVREGRNLRLLSDGVYEADVQLRSVDVKAQSANLSVAAAGGRVIWTIQKVPQEGGPGFRLLVTMNGGSQLDMALVRRISSEDREFMAGELARAMREDGTEVAAEADPQMVEEGPDAVDAAESASSDDDKLSKGGVAFDEAEAAAVVPDGSAPSFDCGKPLNRAESLVCGDREVGELDRRLSKAYRLALSRSDQPEAERSTQMRWLEEKRNACDDAACLRRVYRQRLKYFEGPPHYAYSEHAE